MERNKVSILEQVKINIALRKLSLTQLETLRSQIQKRIEKLERKNKK